MAAAAATSTRAGLLALPLAVVALGMADLWQHLCWMLCVRLRCCQQAAKVLLQVCWCLAAGDAAQQAATSCHKPSTSSCSTFVRNSTQIPNSLPLRCNSRTLQTLLLLPRCWRRSGRCAGCCCCCCRLRYMPGHCCPVLAATRAAVCISILDPVGVSARAGIQVAGKWDLAGSMIWLPHTARAVPASTIRPGQKGNRRCPGRQVAQIHRAGMAWDRRSCTQQAVAGCNYLPQCTTRASSPSALASPSVPRRPGRLLCPAILLESCSCTPPGWAAAATALP